MLTNPILPRILVTVGEPAGIGPDIVLGALSESYEAEITVVGDVRVLHDRASQLGLEVVIDSVDQDRLFKHHRAGRIAVIEIPVNRTVEPGRIDPANARAVIDSINTAIALCMEDRADAIVTAPVHKALINEAGIPFSGHTEWIAERTGGSTPVMMLANARLRVCLATTHLPLSKVPEAISAKKLTQILEIMSRDIECLYRIDNPAIGVLGLNPHAGEGGYLGREELDIILPVIQSLRSRGMNLVGPLPADTAFTPATLASLDAVLAMYHDQGLPVIKHRDFGGVVNVTLGLPLIRTSVDHGTALDLAGKGQASADSLVAAIRLAINFTKKVFAGRN